MSLSGCEEARESFRQRDKAASREPWQRTHCGGEEEIGIELGIGIGLLHVGIEEGGEEGEEGIGIGIGLLHGVGIGLEEEEEEGSEEARRCRCCCRGE